MTIDLDAVDAYLLRLATDDTLPFDADLARAARALVAVCIESYMLPPDEFRMTLSGEYRIKWRIAKPSYGSVIAWALRSGIYVGYLHTLDPNAAAAEVFARAVPVPVGATR